MSKEDYSQPILPQFYADCSHITKRYEKLWGRWELDSQLLHVITEVCELRDVLRNKNDKYGKFGSNEFFKKMHDELSDIFLTAFATANFLGVSIEDLNIGLLEKLAKVEHRVEELENKKTREEKNED